MLAVTLAEMKTDVQEQADLPAFSASTYITTARVTRWLNQAARQFIGLVQGAMGDEWNAAVHTASVATGDESVALPADFYQLRYVEHVLGGARTPMYPATQDNTTYGKSSNLGASPSVPAYRVRGQALELTPLPGQAFSAVLHYASTKIMYDAGATPISVMAADTDYIDGVLGWEDWIVYDVCARCLARMDEDFTRFLALKREIETRISQQVSMRDRQPQRTRETYGGRRFGC